MLQIRQLRPGEEETLFAFLDEVYASLPAKRSRTLWRWQYEQNPFASPGSYTTWVCWHGDRIVGQRPLMPFRLCVDGEVVSAVWAPDFMIRPDYRGRGIGLRLVEAVLRQEPAFVAIDSSAGALRIYEKLGCVRLPDVQRFIFWQRTGLALQRRMPAGMARLLAPLVDRLLRVRRLLFREPAADRFEIVELDGFDRRFEDLWQRSKPDGLLLACRQPDLLDWRYGQASWIKSRILVAQRGDRLIGYLIWRMLPDRRTLVCDTWSENMATEVLEALLRDVIRRCDALMSERVECHATHRALKDALAACGFFTRGSRSMVVHPGLGGVTKGRLAVAQDWYVTLLDGDIDPVFRSVPIAGETDG